MAITGSHVLVYSPGAEALRAFFRDVLGWDHVDAGGGWPIFALPPAEVGVHPGDGPPRQELWLMCDDLHATTSELAAKGVEFRGEPRESGFGTWVAIAAPGGAELFLYEPRHPTAV